MIKFTLKPSAMKHDEASICTLIVANKKVDN